jgi:hypothetical protein
MFGNGTLYSEPAPLVDSSNLETWKAKIEDIADDSGFNVEFENIKINITQNDSFNLLFEVGILMNISDKTEIMGVLKNVTANVLVSIDSIEDPLFPLQTLGRVVRFITISNTSKNTMPLVTGSNASGFVSGYSLVKSSSDVQVGDCDANIILVTDTIASILGIASSCKGVVSEGEALIPPEVWGKAITGATNAMQLVTNGTKIYLDETTKKVWDLGNLTSDIKNGYYHSSNEGASFLDRLEGNITLSPKYKYGLETFVYLPDLTLAGIDADTSLSVLDHKYWNNIVGNSIRNGNYDPVFGWFKIDGASAINYGISDL